MSAEAATAATPVKTKKVAKKQATKPEHPTYKEMVVAAVAALKERKGSSRQAIAKYIKGNYKVNDSCDLFVKSTLVKGVASGALVQASGKGASGSFKLVKVEKKAAPKKKKPAAKKAPAKKVAKKAASPKKAKKPAKKAAKKAAFPKKAAKKSATKRPAAKKPAAKKPVKKAVKAKKPVAKKVAKKPAAKKTAAKKK